MTTDELSDLLRKFEYLEGINVLEFDSKDWARFYRFVENRAKENEMKEKLYTKEQMREAFNAGLNCPIAGATFEEWLNQIK